MLEKYLMVFLVGGGLCLIAQILVIKTKLTPTRILVGFLILGAILEFIGVYEVLIELGHSGAQVAISGFGATVVRGVREELAKEGVIGILTGGMKSMAGGVAAAIFFSYVIALIFDSKSKNS